MRQGHFPSERRYKRLSKERRAADMRLVIAALVIGVVQTGLAVWTVWQLIGAAS